MVLLSCAACSAGWVDQQRFISWPQQQLCAWEDYTDRPSAAGQHDVEHTGPEKTVGRSALCCKLCQPAWQLGRGVTVSVQQMHPCLYSCKKLPACAAGPRTFTKARMRRPGLETGDVVAFVSEVSPYSCHSCACPCSGPSLALTYSKFSLQPVICGSKSILRFARACAGHDLCGGPGRSLGGGAHPYQLRLPAYSCQQ